MTGISHRWAAFIMHHTRPFIPVPHRNPAQCRNKMAQVRRPSILSAGPLDQHHGNLPSETAASGHRLNAPAAGNNAARAFA